jgi:alkylhydroperoxidase family enzyme
MSDITRARASLVARVLTGHGFASPAERRAAFDNTGLGAPLRTLVEKVVHHASRVTDADIAEARASGCSEDQLFEIVVCAAVGAASRQYESALGALAAASTEGESDAAHRS